MNLKDKLFSIQLGFKLGNPHPERLRERYKELVPGRTIEVTITGSLGDDLSRVMQKELLRQTIVRLQKEYDTL